MNWRRCTEDKPAASDTINWNSNNANCNSPPSSSTSWDNGLHPRPKRAEDYLLPEMEARVYMQPNKTGKGMMILSEQNLTRQEIDTNLLILKNLYARIKAKANLQQAELGKGRRDPYSVACFGCAGRVFGDEEAKWVFARHVYRDRQLSSQCPLALGFLFDQCRWVFRWLLFPISSLLLGYKTHNYYEMVSKSKLRPYWLSSYSFELTWISCNYQSEQFGYLWNLAMIGEIFGHNELRS